MVLSRKEAERLIRTGEVTMAGERVTSPAMLIDPETVSSGLLKVNGKAVVVDGTSESQNNNNTRVWLVNKLEGEMVAESDPQGRQLLLDRLYRAGLGRYGRKKKRDHLKPIGRLDMSSEGLILVTNNGEYKRQMELPKHRLHRTYRVKVHGLLTPFKIRQLNRGLVVDGMFYKGMRVEVEQRHGRRHTLATNTWIKITCIEGKNRIIRKGLKHLGCKWKSQT